MIPIFLASNAVAQEIPIGLSQIELFHCSWLAPTALLPSMHVTLNRAGGMSENPGRGASIEYVGHDLPPVRIYG